MIDPKLVNFVNDEIRRGRNKSEINDLLLGAGMSEQDAESFWSDFLQANSVPQGFNVVKPVMVQKQQEINIPIKGGSSVQQPVEPKSQTQESKQVQVSVQSQSSQQNAVNSISKPSNSFKFLVIGVVLIIIAVLAFTAFITPGFLVNHSSPVAFNKNNTTLLNNSNPNLNVSKENVSYITYAIPKTALSTNPNMTIQYPSNWIANTSVPPFLGNVFFYPLYNKSVNQSVIVNVLSLPLSILSAQNVTLQSEIPQIINFYYPNATIGNPENITVSNYPAYEYTILNQTTVSSTSVEVKGTLGNATNISTTPGVSVKQEGVNNLTTTSTYTSGPLGSSVFVFFQSNSNIYEIQYSVINNYSAFIAYLPIAQHMINSISVG